MAGTNWYISCLGKVNLQNWHVVLTLGMPYTILYGCTERKYNLVLWSWSKFIWLSINKWACIYYFTLGDLQRSLSVLFKKNKNKRRTIKGLMFGEWAALYLFLALFYSVRNQEQKSWPLYLSWMIYSEFS